ncbi:MAG: sensor histidine kinase [Lachnospiraceae bacterium]|nr:sensor histidine kinase [Lachnospiraceae bacterium]
MRKRMTKTLQGLIRDTGLRTKMIVLFSALLLLPFGFFAFYAVSHTRDTMREQTLSAAYKAFYDTITAINTKTNRATDVVSLLIYEDIVYRSAEPDAPDYTYLQQLEDYRALSAEFENLKLLGGVSSICLYIDAPGLSSADGQILRSLSEISSLPKFALFNEEHSHQWFSPKDFADRKDASFSCMRMLYNPRSPGSPLAVLRVDLSGEEMMNALHGSSVTEQGVVLLLDGEDILLSYGRPDALPLSGKELEQITNNAGEEWQSVFAGGEACYSYCTTLPDTGWHLVTVIPHREIAAPGAKLRNNLLLVAVFLVVLALAAAVLISALLTRRIRLLSERMQEVESGRMDVAPLSPGKDEVGQLIDHFNNMVAHLRELMDAQVRQGMEIKNLELKALQAQINPHFLYNTLDTINSFAFEKDSPEIRELVGALATFYRISLSKGSDRIPIRSEIAHARAYVGIQKFRFADQITVYWEIEEEIEDVSIIKIVLQPLIENAMIHGIFEKESSNGTITVRAFREGNDAVLQVTDDGVGMTSEEVAQYFGETEEVTTTAGGYGIRNIHARLRLSYGAPYGLSCESEKNKGTTVSVRIPLHQTPSQSQSQ